MTSLFNPDDYNLISNLNLNTIKIPSPENRNTKLLKLCGEKFKNIYLSTGAAKINEIKRSYNFLNKNKVTFYIVYQNIHVRYKYKFKKNRKFKKINLKAKIGISDHSPDILSTLFSLPFGVELIENISPQITIFLEEIINLPFYLNN